MNRRKRIVSTVLEIGLLIALVAGLSFVLQQRSVFGGPSLTEDQSTPAPYTQENNGLPSQPYPAPSEVIPTRTTAQKPPTCQFNNPKVSDSKALKPKLDYSKPKVVLTHDAEIGIAGWLPDNERLLITEDTSVDQSSIETLNVISSEIQTYAKRNGSGEKPVWFNEKNGVIFTTYTNDHYEIWISYGSPEKSEKISNDGSSISLSPDEKWLLYLSQSNQYQPQVWDTSSKLSQPLSIDLRNWEYNRYSNTISVDMGNIHNFQSAWSPDSSKIVFYTNPWVFMFDRNANQLCEIDLGEKDFPRWAFNVQWSPNGQYLALLTTTSLPGMLFSSSELILIDLSTDNSQIINIATDKTSSLNQFTDMAWAPDSSYLATLAVVGNLQGGGNEEGLFIVDPATSTVQQIPNSISLGGGTSGQQLAWSGDLSQLAVNCPTPEEGRLCIINVISAGVQP